MVNGTLYLYLCRCLLLHEHGSHHAVDVHRRRHHPDAHPRRPQEQSAALAQTGPFTASLYVSLSVCLSVCLSVRKKRTGSCVHKDRKIMPSASEAMLRSVRLSVRLFVPCPLIKNGTFYGKNTNRKLHTGSRIHWSAWPWKWPKWPRHIVSAPSTRHLCLYVDFSSFLTMD